MLEILQVWRQRQPMGNEFWLLYVGCSPSDCRTDRGYALICLQMLILALVSEIVAVPACSLLASMGNFILFHLYMLV